jgi:hypothetical protein
VFRTALNWSHSWARRIHYFFNIHFFLHFSQSTSLSSYWFLCLKFYHQNSNAFLSLYSTRSVHLVRDMKRALWLNTVTEFFKALLGNGSVNTRGNEYATVWCPALGVVAVTCLYSNSDNRRRCLLCYACWRFITYMEKRFWAIMCGGGFEYLHRSSASRRRWGKRKPSAWGIIGPLCSVGI